MSIQTQTKQSPRAATDVDELIGANIRIIRRARGMSQERLAGRMGFRFQMMQKYESGASRLAVARLIQLADILDCHPMDFLTGVCNPVQKEQAIWQQVAKVTDYRVLHAFQAIQCPKIRAKVLSLMQTLAGADNE